MRAHRLSVALALAFIPALAFAGDTEWRRYVIPSTGTSVEMPVTIFTRDAGPPEGGTGRRFFTDDNRADLTVQSVPNPNNETPATFLARKRPPAGIIYEDRIWYNRCNRAKAALNCVLINYRGGKAPMGQHSYKDQSHVKGIALTATTQ